MSTDFDVIVVGSGITGGWAAKELTEKGFKVLMIERGRMIEHGVDYATETLAPWELPYRGLGDPELYARDYEIQRQNRHFTEWTQNHFVKDSENPYTTDDDKPFTWFRSYQLGGRSLVWGRQSYRWSDIDFGANKADGNGIDWPIRYADISRWYDHVEEFIGVSGSREGVASLPDGRFQPPMALNVVERHVKSAIERQYPDRCLTVGRVANLTEEKEGRSLCQNRGICGRGCSYGAYFSTQSSTLPAAQATGNLTVLTDTRVESVDYDPQTQRATGVKVINTSTRERQTLTARAVFLNAGSFNSVHILLRSRSDAFPNGLANSSGTLGRYIMDHANALAAIGLVDGFEEHTTFGNRPTGIVIPRFKNVRGQSERFVRGYSYQGGAVQSGWTRARREAGLGAEFKQHIRKPGGWRVVLVAFAESIPRAENRLTLNERRNDAFGSPLLNISMTHGDNERLALEDAATEARAMLEAAGARVVVSSSEPSTPGAAIHEMGGARMGHDASASVLNSWNQAHDVANLFVTDGAAMSSSACQNPSLTYMALTARACDYAATQLRSGAL